MIARTRPWARYVLLGVDGAEDLLECDLDARIQVRTLEFGRKFGAKRLDELDALFVAQQRPAGRIQIRPPVRRAALERLRRRGVGVGGIHLALEGLELIKREVAGTAQR